MLLHMEISWQIPETVGERVRARYGAAAEPWLASVPDIMATLALRWSLEFDDPIGRGNSSVVWRCRRADGAGAVLKLIPEPEIAQAEARALRVWERSGRVPKVFEHDPAVGALLLEAIPNESPLSERDEGVPVSDVADLIGGLHRTDVSVADHGVVSLAEGVERMFSRWTSQSEHNRVVGEIVPIERVNQGLQLAQTLATYQTDTVLLHGDLHPGNVLDGGDTRGLIAIDPRPCIGDPAFDAVDWVFWPVDDPQNWRPRCSELAMILSVDGERLWDWCRSVASMLAGNTAQRGGSPDRVDAFLAMAP